MSLLLAMQYGGRDGAFTTDSRRQEEKKREGKGKRVRKGEESSGIIVGGDYYACIHSIILFRF